MRKLLIIALGATVGVGSSLPLAAQDAREIRLRSVRAQDDEFGKHVKALGSKNLEKREAAWNALRRAGRRAMPALRRAAKSEDIEVRWNAGRLMDLVTSRNRVRIREHEEKRERREHGNERRERHEEHRSESRQRRRGRLGQRLRRGRDEMRNRLDGVRERLEQAERRMNDLLDGELGQNLENMEGHLEQLFGEGGQLGERLEGLLGEDGELGERLEGLFGELGRNGGNFGEHLEGLGERIERELEEKLGDIDIDVEIDGGDLGEMLEGLMGDQGELRGKIERMIERHRKGDGRDNDRDREENHDDDGDRGERGEQRRRFRLRRGQGRPALPKNLGRGSRATSVMINRRGPNGPIRVEIKTDGNTDVYEADSFADFRKKHPKIAKQYGIGDDKGMGFSFDVESDDEDEGENHDEDEDNRHEGDEKGEHNRRRERRRFPRRREAPVRPMEPKTPRAPEAAPEKARLGVMIGVVEDAPEGLDADGALVVIDVIEGSLAQKLGVKTDDILLEIGGSSINGLDDGVKAIQKALSKSNRPKLKIFRPGKGKMTLGGKKKSKDKKTSGSDKI